MSNFDDMVKGQWSSLTRTLGYEKGGRHIVVYGTEPASLEQYLLWYRSEQWKKILAQLWKIRFKIGTFKSNDSDAIYREYYLFLCSACNELVVNYHHGYGKHRICKDCRLKSYSD